MASSSADGNTTVSSPMSPDNPSIVVIIICSAVGFLLLVSISVVIIIIACRFQKKRKEKIRKLSFSDRVNKVFEESLNQKGNAMLREDYERYARSDVSPLNNKPASRKKSETAAYDEVPYSPDDIVETEKRETSYDAKERRRNFSESRSNGIDSGISSIASYGKSEPHSPVGNGSSSYVILKQTPSVDSNVTDTDTNPAVRRRLSSQLSSTVENEDALSEFPVENSDSLALTINETTADVIDDGRDSDDKEGDYNPAYARDDRSLDETDEGVTRL